MLSKQLLFVVLFTCCINVALQIKYPFGDQKSTSKTETAEPKPARPHLTSVIIIVVCVIIMVLVIWGSRLFYVIKMHFFERARNLYTKMDVSSIPV